MNKKGSPFTFHMQWTPLHWSQLAPIKGKERSQHVTPNYATYLVRLYSVYHGMTSTVWVVSDQFDSILLRQESGPTNQSKLWEYLQDT